MWSEFHRRTSPLSPQHLLHRLIRKFHKQSTFAILTFFASTLILIDALLLHWPASLPVIHRDSDTIQLIARFLQSIFDPHLQLHLQLHWIQNLIPVSPFRHHFNTSQSNFYPSYSTKSSFIREIFTKRPSHTASS